MFSVYEFTVKGDALEGTDTVQSVDGAFQGPARKFAATRAKK